MCLWLVIPVSSHFEQTSGSRQNRPIFSTKVVNQNTGFTLSCPFAEQALYKNSPLRVNSTGHVLAKQNRSSRKWLCVATSNWHVHFLSLFVTCYKCFIMPRKVVLAATSKVKTFTDVVFGLLQFLAKIKQGNVVMKLPSNEIQKTPVVLELCKFVIFQLNVYIIEGIDYLHFPSTLWFSMFNTTNNKKMFIYTSKTQSPHKAIMSG